MTRNASTAGSPASWLNAWIASIALRTRLRHREVQRPRLVPRLQVPEPGVDDQVVLGLPAEERLVGDVVEDRVDGARRRFASRTPSAVLLVAAAAAGVVERAEVRVAPASSGRKTWSRCSQVIPCQTCETRWRS